MSDRYRETILDHWRSPRHAEPISGATHRAMVRNASCGDEATVALSVADDRITDIGVTVSGCALATAAGSVLADEVHGQTIGAVKRLRVDRVKQLLGGVEPSLSRESCLRIAFEAFKAALGNPV